MTYEQTSPSIVPGTERYVTAFFERREDADDAIARLAAAGIPRDDISLLEGSRSAGAQSASAREDEGFWEKLKDFFMPDEDRHTYAEGLRRGGYLIGVPIDERQYQAVMVILDTEGAVDIDERSAAWREQGWSGYAGASAESGAMAGAERGGTAGTREAVIPVAEEELRVGKRDVSHGRVRIRSYVVETPVQEQVALREENVEVERRPVDRPVAAGDVAFQERTIEAEERAEEPVVSKEARVKEELVVKKRADERTETVSDQVRRTEVEVDDERDTRSGQPRKR